MSFIQFGVYINERCYCRTRNTYISIYVYTLRNNEKIINNVKMISILCIPMNNETDMLN